MQVGFASPQADFACNVEVNRDVLPVIDLLGRIRRHPQNETAGPSTPLLGQNQLCGIIPCKVLRFVV